MKETDMQEDSTWPTKAEHNRRARADARDRRADERYDAENDAS